MRASHERERNRQRFYAAFKGVDLDKEDKESAQDRLDRIQRRVDARLRGVSEEDIERAADSDLFGLEFEVEE